MLVLRRNSGQSIVIGKHAEIVVKILREDKGVISVGIEAPRTVQVDRLEVYKRKQISELLSNRLEEMPHNEEQKLC
jgi:carbon storage regulator